MEEITVKELVEKSRNDIDSREKLIQIYVERYKYIMNKHKDIINIEEKYSTIIRMIIEEYFALEKKYDMCTQINNKLRIIEKYNAWNVEDLKNINPSASDLFEKASKGDIKSKQKLIEKYMYIAEEAASKIESIYIEKEDALQIGYLLLTKAVNNCLNNEKMFESYYISEGIHHYIDSCYENKIKSIDKNEENYNNSKEITNIEYDLNDEIFKQEFEDFIKKSEIPEKTKLVLLDHIIEQKTQQQISTELNVTRNRINQRLKSSKIKVKTFINIK